MSKKEDSWTDRGSSRGQVGAIPGQFRVKVASGSRTGSAEKQELSGREAV